MSLKKRLEGAGPEVITKLTEERNRAASLLKSANRKISELEAAAVDMKEKLDRAAQENMQVTTVTQNSGGQNINDYFSVKCNNFVRGIRYPTFQANGG